MKTKLLNHLKLNISSEVYGLPFMCDGISVRLDIDNIKNYHLSQPTKDLELIDLRIEARKALTEIKTGDYLKRLDGSISRVTYVWPDHVQDGGGSGSFHMCDNGCGSYSGSLNHGVALPNIAPTKQTKKALFWMFSNNWAGGGRGIYFYCPVKVWKEIKTK